MNLTSPELEDGERVHIKPLLERLLSIRSPRVTLHDNYKGKNKLIWSQFKIAYLDGVEQPYATCKFCLCIMKYSGRTGTGGLVRHFCFREVCKEMGEDKKKGVHTCEEDFAEPYKHNPNIDKHSLRGHLELLISQQSTRIGYIPNFKGKSGVWAQFGILTLDNVPVDFACCGYCRALVTYHSRTGTGSMNRHKCISSGGHKRKLTTVPAILRKNKRYENHPSVSSPVAEEQEHDEDETKEKAVKWEQVKEEPQEEQAEYLSEESSSSNPTPAPPYYPKLLSDYLQTQRTDQATRYMENVVKGKHLAFLKNSLSMLNISENDSFLQLAQALVDLGATYGKVDVRQIFKGHITIGDLLQP